jgi:sacsin
MTDSPQILSGNYLAIFDPLRLHLETSEGKKIDLGHVISNFPNQLLPFGFFMEDGPTSPFQGTVIRCPLRNAPSAISGQVVHGEIISDLFKEFIDQELEISCLFLKNIKCIEIYDATSTGISRLAKMSITRTPLHSTLSKATIELDGDQVSVKKEWLIIEKSFSRDEAVKILLQQPGYDITTVTRTLQGAKFSPEVKIAVDITSEIRGRLFTHLPLPVFTGFPVHVHALFGIDTSRAHLRRASVGLTSGSQDQLVF